MELNEQQIKAIDSDANHILVLAVAGCGKTTVLTERITRLIKEGYSAKQMLAITFTRKAAQQMKERLRKKLDEREANKITIGTSHSFCLSIIRKWYERIGYKENFVIYDGMDKEDIIKNIIEEDKVKLSYKKYNDIINGNRIIKDNKEAKEYAYIVKVYYERLKKHNTIDYDMILDYAVKIIQDNPDVLQYYQNRYEFLFYDEFQDIASLENELCLTMAVNNSFAVGDPDQNIYKFRGTDVKYLLGYMNLGVEIIRLEKNYRNLPEICDVANKIIVNNIERADTKLIPTRKKKAFESRIDVICRPFDNEIKEKEYIIGLIKHNNEKYGLNYKDVAVLSRTNRQVNDIAEVFKENKIPYKEISRDLFWEQPVIKNVIAYLRVILNHHDDYSMQKILRLPHLEIDKITLQELKVNSIKKNNSLFEEFKDRLTVMGFNFKHRYELFNDYDVTDIIKLYVKFIEESMLKADKGYFKDLMTRGLHNKLYLVRDKMFLKLSEFVRDSEDHSLKAFLDWITQVEATDKIEKNEDKVSIMTVHCAKGLEWKTVIITGCEENLFPIGKEENIEEERRLFYVAVTRAKDLVVFTRAKQRQANWSDKVEDKKVSRFLIEGGIENE